MGSVVSTVDLDTLHKGMIIPDATIARDLPAKINKRHRDYGKLVHYWIQHLQIRLEQAGKAWTVCMQNYRVCILSDSEAVVHNEIRFQQGIKKLAKRHWLMLGIDHSQLSPKDLARWQHRLRFQGAVIAKISETKASIEIRPSVRNTPSFLKGND
jgi:hypothetical protein